MIAGKSARVAGPCGPTPCQKAGCNDQVARNAVPSAPATIAERATTMRSRAGTSTPSILDGTNSRPSVMTTAPSRAAHPCTWSALREGPAAHSGRHPHVVPEALKAAAVNVEESRRQLERRPENDGCRAQIHAQADKAQSSEDEDGELRERPLDRRASRTGEDHRPPVFPAVCDRCCPHFSPYALARS